MNPTGSTGAMEPVGTQVIFRRSEEPYKLRYLGFLGDRDSKAFSSVKNVDPVVYEGVDIQKYECCGNVQERMGRHLMNNVSQLKQTSFQYNGKTVKGTSGKVKLSNAAIRKIQGHHGAAIRHNVNNMDKMKKDIWAIWEHRTKKHDNCGSWCPSKKNPPCNPNQNALPPYITDAIKPVFQTLTDDTLLEKCAHGGTQNTNESFHNIIWQHCPRTSFVGRSRLCLAVSDSAIVFNDGDRPTTYLRRTRDSSRLLHCKVFS